MLRLELPLELVPFAPTRAPSCPQRRVMFLHIPRVMLKIVIAVHPSIIFTGATIEAGYGIRARTSEQVPSLWP